MDNFNFSTTVRKVATVEHLVDLVMVVFALASIGNVSEYMVKAGHNVVTAYGVGVALGLGLVAISIMLARVPTDDGRTFASMLVATLAVGLLSGTVQALAYYDHSANVWTACLKGYGFPLVGECLLAVAMAMHTASERKRRARMADDGMEERINDAISDALANIDIAGMQSYIEKQAGLILKHKMAEIVARRTGQLDNGFVQPPQLIDNANVQPVAPGDVQKPQIEQTPAPTLNSLELANEQRQAEIEQRRSHIMNIMSEYMTLGVSELHKLLGGDEVCSRGTLNNDLKALADANMVYNADRKWHIVSAVSVELPTMAAPVLNGHSHE